MSTRRPHVSQGDVAPALHRLGVIRAPAAGRNKWTDASRRSASMKTGDHRHSREGAGATPRPAPSFAAHLDRIALRRGASRLRFEADDEERKRGGRHPLDLPLGQRRSMRSVRSRPSTVASVLPVGRVCSRGGDGARARGRRRESRPRRHRVRNDAAHEPRVCFQLSNRRISSCSRSGDISGGGSMPSALAVAFT